MTTTAIILSGLLGLIVAGLATYIGNLISQKVTITHWIINLILGILGSIASTQLLPGAFGPIVAGVSLIPSIVGSLVLAGVGTWTINFLKKK